VFHTPPQLGKRFRDGKENVMRRQQFSRYLQLPQYQDAPGFSNGYDYHSEDELRRQNDQPHHSYQMLEDDEDADDDAG
jgi:hypothetical protein